MKKIIFIFLTFLSIADAQIAQRFINVMGTSELTVVADQINITVQIRTVDQSIEVSKKNNDKNLKELLSILNNLMISKDNMEMAPVLLGKNYEYTDRGRVQKGYFTESKVNFLLKDLSKYYEVINKLSGHNSFEIINSTYETSDYERQHQLAYEQALSAAKAKAEYMTKAMGLELHEVLEIEEINIGEIYPPVINSFSAKDSAEPDISGKITIKRSVRIKFSLN